MKMTLFSCYERETEKNAFEVLIRILYFGQEFCFYDISKFFVYFSYSIKNAKKNVVICSFDYEIALNFMFREFNRKP